MPSLGLDLVRRLAVPFIAQCPHCKSAKFKVPWKKHETVMACPGCAQEFELIPFDAPPDRSKLWSSGKAVAPETLFSITSTVPDTVKRPAVEPVIAVEASEPAIPSQRAIDLPLVFALAALVGIGVAIIAAPFPYGRFLSLGVCLFGLLLAGFSLFGLERRRGLGWAGVSVHSGMLFLLTFAPAWLGAGDWLPAPEPVDQSTIVFSAGHDGGVPVPAEWVDASSASWQQNDLRVAVLGTRIAPLDPKAKTPDQRKPRGWFVTLQLSNVGVARGIDIGSSGEKLFGIRMLSTSNKTVAWKKLEETVPVTIFPGKSIERTLVFEVPAERSETWRLEIPAETFANRDPIRLRIPNTMIGR
jgi:hypothetical protein